MDDVVFHLQEACDLEETVALAIDPRALRGRSAPLVIGFRVGRYGRARGARVQGWIFNCSGRTKGGRKASFAIHALDSGRWSVEGLRIVRKS